MASFRKRNDKWQVQVRRAGHPCISRTFSNKADAATWARLQEHLIETGGLLRKDRSQRTLGDLLDRYERDVIPLKRTNSTEDFMLRVLRRHPMTLKPLSLITAQDIASFRDRRLSVAKPSSVVRQLSLLRHALKVADTKWGWATPVMEMDKVRFPTVVVHACARISDESFQCLLQAAKTQKNKLIVPFLEIALGTAMRRSEILNLQWKDVDFDRFAVTIKMSKNGRSRTIPITPKVASLLKDLDQTSDLVLPISANCLRLGFERARQKALVQFRLHDLRHEAISRFFETGLTIPEVQLISGHCTLSQLSRYSHPDVKKVAAKLAASLS
jgi:integrase